jgi:hypothetical protein
MSFGAWIRFNEGYSGYLEVLDSQRSSARLAEPS